jgi:antitoxin HigA-1
MPMKNPPHPGGFVFRQCIEPLGLSITKAAAALGVTRTTLSELVNGRRGISPEMAVRISKVFGGSAESWLTQQAHYDLAQVRVDRIKLKRLRPAPAVLEDDWGRRFLARRGRVPKDVDLEF